MSYLFRKTRSPQQWRKHLYTQRVAPPFSRFSLGSRRRRRRFFSFRFIFKTIGGLILFGIIFGSIGAVGLVAWVSKDLPNPDQIIQREIPLSTKIYDRTGKEVLYDIHGNQKRTMVELADIPDTVKQATLTAEDRKFYEHQGVSLTGIIRSLIKNVTTGSKVGGSTLTQQLVKNVILSSEKTYTRKLKEVILSYQIEKKFSKDQILKMYFNEIPYGSTAYGIEAAAQTYFGKSIKDVNLAEAAILAAITQAPTYYSNNKEKLIARQHWILGGMAEQGYITAEQAETAKKEAVQFKKLSDDITAPHFVMFIKEYLSQKYGEKTVEQGGLKVITTLDNEKQKIAEEVITEKSKNNEAFNASNAALVSIDAKTGQIIAMVGSKDYFNDAIDGQVNVVTRSRQPGSSFKPIVYAAAFRKGYTPTTILYDVVTTFTNYDGKPYDPLNYNLKENGPVTMRQALAGSLNIPAVKTIYLTGIDKVLDLADELGYTTLKDRSRFGLSLVLGGGEVKLLEHVLAFAAFAREGERPEITGILSVEDKDGNILEEFKEKKAKVLETEVARQINDILSDNAARAFIFGEKNHLTLANRPVAAKTGTTNDYRDAWTIGYTPSVATGVWVGNNDFSEMKRGADGSVVAAPIWQAYMEKILNGTPVEEFTKPKEAVTGKPVLDGTTKDGIKVKIDRISGKLATEFTPREFIEEKNFQAVHCILYYVDKDNPQGPTLANPADDPQFTPWEEAVKKWAEKQGIISQDPPTEYDDTHTSTNRPNLTIISPVNNQKITDRNFTAQINTESPQGMAKVEYYINDNLIKTEYQLPFSLSIFLGDPGLENGYAQLKVIAYDDIGNAAIQTLDLNMMLPDLPYVIKWLSPADQAALSQKDFPLKISLNIENLENISKVTFFYKKTDGVAQFINTVRQFWGSQTNVQWFSYPGPGSYVLYAEITNADGFNYKSKNLNLTIE